MSTLTGNKISLTYKSIFKTSDNDILTAALKQMSDGFGNNSGIYLNTGGDLKSTGILEFANFKGTSTAVSINRLVNEADGISNNDNDTSLPTSAAVKDYVDTHVTTQDLDFKGDSGTGAVDLDSQLLDIAGTTNEIVTSATAQKLTIGLPNSVTISGTYTGTTFSGDLSGTINTATTATTQSSGTSNTTVATTKFVMDLDSASDLDFSGTTGTGDVNLNTQSFAVTGTANQIVTAASNQGLQISLLSTGVTMPNGSVATTQSAGDNSTKLATTAYVDVLDSASDLDITDGSNTSDVNLNTQSLSILGTTNEIVSTVSAQTATISLPSTINVNVTGNVTGALTGNADTATKWQTPRNLSVSGEATGTISNVDGSVAVSGAVTLTNSAVVGKVLTGLPTPAAGNIQASDSILEAFGKVQSQINSISSGLVFKGSWDAATNTPTLLSGGGEVDSGITDGATTAFKLIQSGQNFNTSVSVGNKVVNQVDGTTALVTVIDSNTQLTLDTDIMLTGEAYTIDASPFIPQGNYYVVNFAGTTPLNGINVWSIGDWVIADADNRWSKLDHSQIDGQGTIGNLPVFSTATTIGDSIVAQAGTALTITGSATTTLGLSSTGNFAVNTNKFTANATTGNVAFTGDLAINTNKFTVNATNGNTVVGGTLNSGAITSTGQISCNTDTTTPTNGQAVFYKSSAGTVVSGYQVILESGGAASRATALTISDTGKATFTGNVLIGTNINSSIGLQVNQSLGSGNAIAFLRNSAASAGNGLVVDVTNTPSNYIADFRIGNSSKVRIDSSGNVGIGTDSPDGKLQVTAASSSTSNGNDASYKLYLTNTDTTNNNYSLINFTDSDGSSSSGCMGLQYTDHTNNYGELCFITRGASGYGERMRIDSSGNVGIGTDDPDYTLHLLKSSGDTEMYINGQNGQSSLRMGLDARNWQIKTAAAPYLWSLNYVGTDFQTPNIITATTGGNVGIGTSNPIGNGLTVAASTNGKGVEIQTSASLQYVLAFDRGASAYIPLAIAGSELVFQTGSGATESMRIDSSGKATFTTDSGVLIKGATGSANGKISFLPASGGRQYDLGNVGADFRIFDASANVTRMYFDNDGNTGIGTDSPDHPLEVVGVISSADTGLQKSTFANVGNDLVLTANAGQTNVTANIIFKSSGSGGAAISEKMRITSGGDVKINTTISTLGKLSIKSDSGAGTFYNNIQCVPSDATTGGLFIGSNVTNDAIMVTGAYYQNAGNYTPTATSASSINMFSGNIIFRTNNNLTIGTNYVPTERMRITSGGDVEITGGYATSSAFRTTGALRVLSNSSSGTGNVALELHNDATGGRFLASFTNLNGVVGSITTSGSLTGFNTSSDYRLKEDLQDFEGLDMVSKIPVYNFKWKTDKSRSYGVIAHELQEVLPQAVSGEKDAEEMQGVDYSKIVPLLIKSIQELTAKVEKLEKECKCK